MAENERPRLEKMFDGEVKVKKKSTARKIADVFFSDDIHSIGDSILFDLLVPNIIDTIVNIVESGVEMLFYGKSNGGKRRKRSNGTIIAYDKFSSGDRVIAPRSSGRSVYDVADAVFDSRGTAELVVDQLIDLIDRYNEATVHDFYDACGITTTNHNDFFYGWKNLQGTIVTKGHGGWVINLPEPQQLR